MVFASCPLSYSVEVVRRDCVWHSAHRSEPFRKAHAMNCLTIRPLMYVINFSNDFQQRGMKSSTVAAIRRL